MASATVQHSTTKPLKITLIVCPPEGEVVDPVSPKVYKPAAVKYMPLGLLSVAANIPAPHTVSVIDASSLGLSVDEVLERIEQSQPDVLGLSVVTYRAWAMREILRKSSAPIKVVGGPHATYHHAMIRQQGAHAVFVGDAEKTFPQWLADGCPPGLFRSKPVDLNTIPFPARHLMNLDDYRIQPEPGTKLLFNAGGLRLPMFSSKGCALKCIYCDVQQKEYNAKEPQVIYNEFTVLKDLGATSIHVLDDTFNMKKNRVMEMCDLLIKNQFPLSWSVRGIVEVREEIIKTLKEAGCTRFHAGIEHLDDHVLKIFRKSQRYKDVAKFCALCNKYDIDIVAYFVLGAPDETDEYRERLPDMIRELGIRMPFFNILTPLSETEYYFDLLKKGMFKTNFWQEFVRDPVRDFVIPQHRTQAEELALTKTLAHYLDVFGPSKSVTS
ncbi:MAG: B12-binding domain-containing radical SAM protein [Magnetococcus sp. DMHC-8]